MGKKDKNKFKKRLRAEILKEMTKSETTSIPKETVANKANDIENTEIEQVSSPQINYQPQTVSENSGDDVKSIVKHDLKKSALIIGSIFIVIIALYFVDQKTNILLSAGNFVFTKFNINH